LSISKMPVEMLMRNLNSGMFYIPMYTLPDDEDKSAIDFSECTWMESEVYNFKESL